MRQHRDFLDRKLHLPKEQPPMPRWLENLKLLQLTREHPSTPSSRSSNLRRQICSLHRHHRSLEGRAGLHPLGRQDHQQHHHRFSIRSLALLEALELHRRLHLIRSSGIFGTSIAVRISLSYITPHLSLTSSFPHLEDGTKTYKRRQEPHTSLSLSPNLRSHQQPYPSSHRTASLPPPGLQ